MRLDDGPACVLVLALLNYIQIFFQRGSHRGNVLRLLGSLVEPALGIERVDLLAILEHVKNRDVAAIVRILLLRVRAAGERVWADGQLVSVCHFFFRRLIERSSHHADANESDTDMNYVSAVAARVTARQVHHRGRKITSSLACDNPPAANELRRNGEDDKRTQDGGHQRVKIRDAQPRTQAEWRAPRRWSRQKKNSKR